MKNNNLGRENLLEEFIQLVEEYNITAYELEKNTGFSAVGIQKIIDGKTKRPQEHTLQTIISYIKSKRKLKDDSINMSTNNQISINNRDVKVSEELINDINTLIEELEGVKTTDAFTEKLRLFKLKNEAQDFLDKLKM